MYEYGIFIFRKDLRIQDNRGLLKMQSSCKQIIPIFIFDSNQVDKTSKTKNYLSYPALRFICEAVSDLNSSILKLKSKLYIFYGKPIDVLNLILVYLLKQEDFKNKICLGFNQDFTQYSIQRDGDIVNLCTKLKIPTIINSDDYTMYDMEELKKDEFSPYKQYGAFKKNMLSKKNKFNKPDFKKIKFYQMVIKFTKVLTIKELDDFWSEELSNLNYKPLEIGSRNIGLKILSNLKKFSEYADKRDILSYETTHLSAYLNFGLISEREFYYELVNQLGNSTQLINQIIWRDYYLCLLRYLPGANSYTEHVDPRYNKIKWTVSIPIKTSKVWKEWELMMKSKTGFLIIDAGIQEILNTGYMHNRCRMIVGVFAIKYLQINPLCRYIGLSDWFSRHLLDCNTSQNKLNTQWLTEFDYPGKKFSPHGSPIAGRPMNISNIMIKKWDPDCIYIKKWLPHLASIDNKILYSWDTKPIESIHPKPIFDPKERYQKWILLCASK